MISSPPVTDTFDAINYPTLLFAGAIVIGSVVVVEEIKPEYGVPYAVVILLGVGLLWRDSNNRTALEQTADVLGKALGRLQQGTGITPSVPSGITNAVGGLPPSPPPPSNLLPGMNQGSLFGGPGITVSTPFGYGSKPGEHYSFGGLTVHQGVDVIPQGLTSVQAIGHNVYNVIGGTVVGIVQGDAEHRGIVLNIGHGLYEHIYHIDPSSFTPGQYVAPGGFLGRIAAMAGAHVHYELRTTPTVGGRSIDPTSYLR